MPTIDFTTFNENTLRNFKPVMAKITNDATPQKMAEVLNSPTANVEKNK